MNKLGIEVSIHAGQEMSRDFAKRTDIFSEQRMIISPATPQLPRRPRTRFRNGLSGPVLGLLLGAVLSGGMPLAAGDAAFRDGDVFAGVAGGQVPIFADGRLRHTLQSPSGGQQTGMCFDLEGNLYTTDFEKSQMSKFDKHGRLLVRDWGGPFSTNPESCVVDAGGNVYTGEVYGENRIRKFDAGGRLLATFRPQVEGKGVDWIDLAADQCTMFYTSEGSRVMRYDVCRQRQLPDFARGLAGACFALRLRENGELMVACRRQVYRLSPNGSVRQKYPIANESLFAMNLDPDGVHFWTGGISSGNVYKVDIESGRGTAHPLFNARGTRTRKSGSVLGQLQNLLDSAAMGGLTVYGERTAAIAKAVRREEERQREAARRAEEDRLAAQRRAEEERQRQEAERLAEEKRRQREEDERRQREEEEEERRRREKEERRQREEDERRQREEEEERRRREEEERRKRLGRVTFGPPRSVDLGRLTAQAAGQGRLDLSGTEVDGSAEARLTTTLRGSGLRLEIETADGWMPLTSEPLALGIEQGGRRDWPLRLRAGRCPTGVAEGDSHHILIEATGPDQRPTSLRIPLAAVVVESSWLQCWWPVLATVLGVVLVAIGIHGLVSPSRFAPRLGVVLSPEEDMTEGHFHAIRAQRGSRSGFYRDARVYVTPDYRVTGRGSGALVRLRAESRQVRIQPTSGATVWRRTAADEWEPLPAEESRMPFGTVYRDDFRNLYFELRSA